MFVDTANGHVLGLHLGMSGRVIVDDVEAGDPLIYASNQRVEAWHRFGVRFVDGGSFMLRDPRRLGAVELDPDESRLGPDALTLTYKQLDHALDARTAPVKAVLMDQARVAGLGNLLVDESLVARRCRPGASSRRSRCRCAQEPASCDQEHRTGARPAGWEPHGRHAARSGRGVPARRHAVAAPNGRRAHDVLVSGSPTLNPYDRRRDRAVGAQDRTPGAAAVARNRPRALRRAQRRSRSDAPLPGAADASGERRDGRRGHGELRDPRLGTVGGRGGRRPRVRRLRRIERSRLRSGVHTVCRGRMAAREGTLESGLRERGCAVRRSGTASRSSDSTRSSRGPRRRTRRRKR